MDAIELLKWPRRRYLKWRGPAHVVKRDLTYREDGLFTANRAAGFLADPRFERAYQTAVATGSWGGANIRWRMHIILTAAANSLHLKGDFVECGVNRGGYAAAICEYLAFGKRDRSFWLMDTFRGVPIDQTTPVGHYHQGGGYYVDCYEEVRRTFASYPNVKLVRGTIPATLGSVTPESVAFMSIDMNSPEPERAALEHFWPRLSHGAYIILDDYGWTAHRAQKVSADEFARAQGVGIFELPTGQGLLIKP